MWAAAAAGWLFGAEAAAETTSILIAYEMKQAGDEKPYDVAIFCESFHHCDDHWTLL